MIFVGRVVPGTTADGPDTWPRGSSGTAPRTGAAILEAGSIEVTSAPRRTGFRISVRAVLGVAWSTRSSTGRMRVSTRVDRDIDPGT